MSPNENKRTFAAAEQYAAEHGIILSPADRQKIAAIQAEELKRQKQINPQNTGDTFADKFNRFYPRLLDAMLAAGDIFIAFAKTLILAGGVPVILAILLVVEWHRVKDGIAMFDVNPTFASFSAIGMVFANFILEMLIHHTEHKAGYTPEMSQQWSLRIWWQNMRYTLGIGDTWTPRDLSPAHRLKRVLRLVTFTILALALVGSMKDVIADTGGAWYAALISIVTESDLLRMSTWIGGLLFAAAAVLTAQVLSRYVSVQTVEIVAAMRSKQTERVTPYAEELDTAAANFVYGIVADRLAKQRAKTSPVTSDTLPEVVTPSPVFDVQPDTVATVTDFLSVTPSPLIGLPTSNGHHNGNGNGHHHGDA